jgi:hypothetical protein
MLFAPNWKLVVAAIVATGGLISWALGIGEKIMTIAEKYISIRFGSHRKAEEARTLTLEQRTTIRSYIEEHGPPDSWGYIELQYAPTSDCYEYALDFAEVLKDSGLGQLYAETLSPGWSMYRKGLWIIGTNQNDPPTHERLRLAFEAAGIKATCAGQSKWGGVTIIIGAR